MSEAFLMRYPAGGGGTFRDNHLLVRSKQRNP